MTDKELIKQEIERRMSNLWYLIPEGEKVLKDDFTKEDANNLGKYTALENLLKFIDSLLEKSGCEVNFTTKSEDLEEEIERFAYSLPHSATGFWPKDIDAKSVEARTKYGVHHGWSYEQVMNIARHFAEWQKQQMKEALQTEYKKGRFDMREEMMKDAVECIVEDWCGDSPEITIPLNSQDFKTGDRVKTIILKTE